MSAIIVLTVMLVVVAALAYLWGRSDGKVSEIAKHATIDKNYESDMRLALQKNIVARYDALARALGWKYEPATNDHLARWVQLSDDEQSRKDYYAAQYKAYEMIRKLAKERATCAAVSVPSVVTTQSTCGTGVQVVSHFVTGFKARGMGQDGFSASVDGAQPAASGSAPKPKRARGSSRGAGRKGGKS